MTSSLSLNIGVSAREEARRDSAVASTVRPELTAEQRGALVSRTKLAADQRDAGAEHVPLSFKLPHPAFANKSSSFFYQKLSNRKSWCVSIVSFESAAVQT